MMNTLVMAGELYLLAGIAMALHAMSRRWGMAPLLLYLAALAAIVQAMSPVAATVSLGGESGRVVVASVTQVPVILLILLVLYEVEGTVPARGAIRGIMGVSLLVLVLQLLLRVHLLLPGGGNLPGLSIESSVYRWSPRFTGASIVAFLASLLAMPVVYQWLSNRTMTTVRWAVPGGALVVALLIDDVVFRSMAFGWGSLQAGSLAGTVAKAAAGVLLLPPTGWYLGRVAPRLEGYLGPQERPALEVLFGSSQQQERALRTTVEGRRRAERALEASEVRFRTTFERVGVGLVHSSDQGRILMANRAMAEMLGYTPEELAGTEWASLTHPDDRADNREGMLGLLAGEVETYESDKRYLRKDGRAVWAHITVNLVREPGSGAHYFVAAVEDLTERRATEERLRQLQKMEAVGQLTGGIAHDFNNLLTVIMGGVELGMQEEAGGEEQRRALQDAMDSAARGAALTQRLLAFSRKQALRPTAVDPDALLKGLQELLTRTLGETIAIRMESTPGVGRCLADPAQMENAILNLALNSRDAMPEGGELRIHVERVGVGSSSPEVTEALPGEYVRIAVRDNGHGIPAQHMSKIFEPFFTTKETGKGSGLGLSMVYGFAQQSGGFVTLESQEGHGTLVSLHLPVAEA